MLDSDDSRNFMRMSVNADAKLIIGYDAEGDHEQIMDAVCLDLSATGASLHVNSAIETGQQVAIYIRAGKVPAFKALAKVIRSERLEDGNYQLGCKITQLL